MKLYLVGQRSSLGGGIHFSEFCNSLLKLSELPFEPKEVDASNGENLMQLMQICSPTDVIICFIPLPNQLKFCSFLIGWAIFESTSIDDIRLNFFYHCDVLWTPSIWGKDILIEHGFDSKIIDVIPEGVNPAKFHPFLRNSSKRKKPFRFLSVGKFEERKSYRELLTAFKTVYGDDKSVELVIKADYFAEHGNRRDQIQKLIESNALLNVRIVYGNLDDKKLFTLYSMCDIFVAPSKGEGWGLPIIEAAACGLPIMATLYSGHSSFLNEIRKSVYEIEYSLADITDKDFLKFNKNRKDLPYGRWAIPKISSIEQGFLYVKQHFPEFDAEAFYGSSIIRKKYSWDSSVTRALSSISDRGLTADLISFA